MADSLLQVIHNDYKIPISIVVLIKDDPKMQGMMIENTLILTIDEICF